jgi:hypothetical protein
MRISRIAFLVALGSCFVTPAFGVGSRDVNIRPTGDKTKLQVWYDKNCLERVKETGQASGECMEVIHELGKDQDVINEDDCGTRGCDADENQEEYDPDNATDSAD